MDQGHHDISQPGTVTAQQNPEHRYPKLQDFDEKNGGYGNISDTL